VCYTVVGSCGRLPSLVACTTVKVLVLNLLTLKIVVLFYCDSIDINTYVYYNEYVR